MAVTGTGPVLGALTNGANAVSAVTWGSGYATDTGTLAPVVRQIRRGTNPWRAVAATELVTTGQTVRFREVVFNTDYVGEAFTTDEVTVGAAAIAAQTAYFGASTLSGQGGFKPVDAGGADEDVISIVSGGDTSPAAQVVDGRLSFAGTGAPNGATIRVETAGGEVDITIATVPGKSIADPQHLAVALFAQRTASTPIDLMLRPGAYDVNASGASPAGIFQSRNIPEAAQTTIKPHPSQASRPYFYKPNEGLQSGWNSTHWITITGCDFNYELNNSQMITGGSNTGITNQTHDITFDDVTFYGPRVSDEALEDPVNWPAGYLGAYGVSLPLGPKLVESHNITLRNCRFQDVFNCGDYNPENLRLENVEGRRIYGDGFRLSPRDDKALPYETPCVFYRCRVTDFFGVNNEMEPTTGELTPHNDAIQVVGGGRIKWLVVEQCYMTRGDKRGDVMTTIQQNAHVNRATYHESVFMNKGSPWGRNDEGAEYNLLHQCSFLPSDLAGSANIRFGAANLNRPAIGEQRLVKTYIGSSASTTFVTINMNSVEDPASIVNDGSYYPLSNLASDDVTGPADPTLETLFDSAKPIIGGTLDVGGIGALTTSGEFRGTGFPPLPGQPPTLVEDGADVVLSITPSIYVGQAGTAPASWEWRHRAATYEDWSAWNSGSGTSAVGVGLNTPGHMFMYRYVNSAGVAGVPSLVSALPGTPPPLAAPNLLDLALAAQTTATDEFDTLFDPLRLVSTGATTSRGGWTFSATAGERYLITWEFDSLAAATGGAAIRITTNAAMPSTGALYSSPLTASGSVIVSPTTTATHYIGPALVIPPGETIGVTTLLVQAL